MSQMSLAKMDLPPQWKQAAIGEPIVVRENLFSHFDIPNLMPSVSTKDFDYSPPAGFPPLVRFLEEKFQKPIVIHGGAKQAIGALFFALKKSGFPNIFLRNPWWSLFLPLIEMSGCHQVFNPYGSETAQLLVSPGNPDGQIISDEDWKENEKKCRELGVPIIHDGAYHSHSFLPPEIPLKSLGDVQIFTCSKLFGLSQLRIGFSVFHDTKLYNDVLAFQETTTVGISVLSQMFALNIFQEMKNNPEKTLQFEAQNRFDLAKNRETAAKINPKILEIKTQNTGMFLWAQCHDLKRFEEKKIVVAEGTNFGMSGMIRMNLGLKNEDIEEIVRRLNGDD